MVDLMLEDACQPAFGFDLHRLAVAVQSLDLNGGMPLHFTDQVGDGEAALHTHQHLFGGFDDFRVGDRPHFLGSVLLIFIFLPFIVFHNDETFRESDLRRGQPDARSFTHGLHHVID